LRFSYDSGAGFVKKYKSLNNISIVVIYWYSEKCLIKHNTSARGLDKSDKGKGLDPDIRYIGQQKRGVSKDKTDQLCLYRDLISDKYKLIWPK
jgi:hypothetical protein